MVREIIHDAILLARKSEPATAQDLPIAQDLLDTLIAHKDGCVGMAAPVSANNIKLSKYSFKLLK